MPLFDPFGLKKESAQEPAPGGEPGLKTAKLFLGAMLALSAALTLVCAGGLAARVRRLVLESKPAAALSGKGERRPSEDGASHGAAAAAKQAPTQKAQPQPAAPGAAESQGPRGSAVLLSRAAESPAKPPEPAAKAHAPPQAKAVPAAPAPAKEAPKAPAPPQAKAAPAAPAAAPAPAKASTTKKIEFSHSDPSAKEALLLGAFLVRSKGRAEMAKFSSGEWRLTLTLVTGTTYSYRIETVDGQGKRRVSPKQSVFVSP
ncbi:MAG: hypothetical protein HY922_09490 [Elusimicrobia bacterium]|nr:hypothetical protein [Elusimicrobiota bacterium]